MNRTYVVSSNIKSIGWGPEGLEVEFNTGKVYLYAGVPYDLYLSLMEAESKGQFLNQNIKGKFSFRAITPDPVEEPEDLVGDLVFAGLNAAIKPSFEGEGGSFGGAGATGSW